ncbi:MAG: 2Fe-2S iron-sulfur cluster binding domain-containing protein, partial [Peptostreptococcaceae bacterium]
MMKVLFKSHKKEVYCKKGDLLLDVARAADIFIDAPCNGNVSCGKCKVKLVSGNVDTEQSRHISDNEMKQGYILACNSKVVSDIEIDVPSKLSSSMHGMKIEGGGKEKDEAIFNRAKKIAEDYNLKFSTNIRKKYIELSDPT